MNDSTKKLGQTIEQIQELKRLSDYLTAIRLEYINGDDAEIADILQSISLLLKMMLDILYKRLKRYNLKSFLQSRL